MTLAQTLVSRAAQSGAVMSTAESCTGGLISAAITDVAGSSAVFDRGFVTYSNAAKMDMLGVTDTSLDAFGAVSEEVAVEMAQGALARSDATLCVSVTGIAGPGGSDHKPEGRVCFACAGMTGVVVETVEFGALGRDAVRAAARDHALKMLLAAVT